MANEVIRIFVGTPANNEDLECQCVLDYSIRKHCSEPILIEWMMLSRNPASFWYSDPQARRGWQPHRWATPFSPLRWVIPEACGFEGRAIYMDCDQIALADIAELWRQPVPAGKGILMSKDNASCVMLFENANCKSLPKREAHWRDPELYRRTRRVAMEIGAVYEGDWNCRDGRNSVEGGMYKTIHDPRVKVLHYTSIPTQPNHKYARVRLKGEGKAHWFPGPDLEHPVKEIRMLFDQMLAEAIACGAGPETFRQPTEFGDYGRPRAA